ncbi:MAG: GAF domain-containing protein [Acidobacteriota bacterium]
MSDLEELLSEIRELKAINAIGSLTCQPFELGKILNRVIDLIVELLNCEIATIALLDEASNRFQLKIHRGLSEEFVMAITTTARNEGAAQYSVAKKAPIFLKISEYPEIPLKEAAVKEGIQWIISTPMLRKNEIIGIINIAGRSERTYSAHDCHLLSLIAERIAMNIENYKLLREAHERSAQMASLLHTGALLISSLDLEKMLKNIVEEAAKLVGTDSCTIFFYDPERDLISGQIACGLPDEVIKSISLPINLFPAAEEAIKKKKPIEINDLSREKRAPREVMDRLGFKSSLSVPLFFMENPLGIIFFEETRFPKRFTHSEIELAMNFANYVSVAIQNARLFKEATERREQAEAIQLIGQALTSRLDYQEVLRSIANYAKQLSHAKFAFVSTKEGYYFRPVAIAGDDEGYASIVEFTDDPESPLGLGPGGRAARSKLPAVISNCEKDPTFAPWKEEALKRGIRSHVSIPLISKGTTFGVLAAYSSELNGFDRKNVTLLLSFANFAAIALENARLYRELKLAFENLKETQSRLVQTEKLSAIGEMVAGVAHEINNPLTSVLGFSQLLLGQKVDSKVKSKLIRISDEAMRCAKIVQNLLAFARKQKPEKRHVGINGIIESVLDLISYQLKVDNITIVKELDDNLTKTMADYNQLQQVFLNIINNAQQAMTEQGGSLTIKTEVTGRSIRITFKDTGPGISKENIKKVFDPFFTTKPPGKGTGLGLSLCYGIVREHGGTIRADSGEGQGATFIIELPIIEDRKAVEKPLEERKAAQQPASELDILVIDDEQMIIDLLFEFFSDHGYNVETATSGETAIEKILRKDYDVIICDLKMPGISGQDIYSWIKNEKPDAASRIVFSTGDTLTQNVRDFFRETGNLYISKPFNFQNLLSIAHSLCKP